MIPRCSPNSESPSLRKSIVIRGVGREFDLGSGESEIVEEVVSEDEEVVEEAGDGEEIETVEAEEEEIIEDGEIEPEVHDDTDLEGISELRNLLIATNFVKRDQISGMGMVQTSRLVEEFGGSSGTNSNVVKREAGGGRVESTGPWVEVCFTFHYVNSVYFPI